MTIEQDKDVLAAEYVLGTLGPDERGEAQALIAADPAFAEIVRGWERRLGELSAMVDPVEPPADMWDRIRAGIAGGETATLTEPAIDALEPNAAAPEQAWPPQATPAASDIEPSAEKPFAAESVAAEPTPARPLTAESGTGGRAIAQPAAAEPAAETSTANREREPAQATTRAAPAAPLRPVAADPAAAAALAPRAAAPVPPVIPPRRPVDHADAPSDAEVIALAARVRRWRAATVLTGALAACFLALVVIQEMRPDLLPVALQPTPKTVEVVHNVEVPSPRPAEFVAVLQKDAASPAFLLTFDLDKQLLTVRTVGAEQQTGKSYELWLVSDKYPAPRSLGVIGDGPYTVRPAAPDYDAVILNRATYAVSLEPQGGSPTGEPTGPVLYTGRLVRATAPDFPAHTP